MENIWYVSFTIIFIIISGYCVYLMCRKEEITFESVFVSGRLMFVVVLLLISITLLVAVLLCEFDEVRKNVLSTTGTALVSILTGVFSSTLVSAYYRDKDNKRDKEDYVNNLEVYIRTVSLYLTNISLYKKDEEKNIAELQIFLKNTPRYREEYKLSEKERNIQQCFIDKQRELVHNINLYRNGEWAVERNFKEMKKDARKQKETARLNFGVELTEWTKLRDMWND